MMRVLIMAAMAALASCGSGDAVDRDGINAATVNETKAIVDAEAMLANNAAAPMPSPHATPTAR